MGALRILGPFGVIQPLNREPSKALEKVLEYVALGGWWPEALNLSPITIVMVDMVVMR